MTRAYLFAALLSILLPVGCGKKDAGLSGTYRASPPVPDWTITFQHDGTFESKSTGGVVNGTYRLDGTKLTVTTTEVNGKPVQGNHTEPRTATLSEDGKSFDTGGAQYRKQD